MNFVWVLILLTNSSYGGGAPSTVVVDNIVSYSDCKKLGDEIKKTHADRPYMKFSCHKVKKL